MTITIPGGELLFAIWGVAVIAFFVTVGALYLWEWIKKRLSK